MPKKSGFTLIELLVTISIISILAAIGLITYTNVLKQGRDSKRISDLRTIQSGLEQYYSDQGFYPTVIHPGASNPYYVQPTTPPLALTSSIGNPASPPPSPVKTYINAIPTNPIIVAAANDYLYLPYPALCNNNDTKCTRYCIYTNTERQDNSNRSQVPAYCNNDTMNLIGTDDAPGTFNYAAASP